MTKTLALFKDFPQTKEDIRKFQTAIKLDLLSGEVNILQPYVKLRMLQEALTILKDEFIEDEVLLQLEKYPEKSPFIYGCQMTKKSAAGSWNYKVCDDQALVDLEIKQVAIDEAIKARKAFLQAIPLEGTADPSTGEVINKAIKTPGKDSFSLKIL